MPFKSRAQEKWAFATKQPWAEEWAAKTTQRKELPDHVRRQGRSTDNKVPK